MRVVTLEEHLTVPSVAAKIDKAAIAKRGNVTLSAEASASEQETEEPPQAEEQKVARTLQRMGELPGPAEITP